jgi:thiamine biosynthesis lipoprotein
MKQITLLLALFALLTACNTKQAAYIKNTGSVFGTYFNIVYQNPDGTSIQAEIENLLDSLNNSLSTYEPKSVLSKVNNNQQVKADSFFSTVFIQSIEIAQKTQGAFDPTVAPLVNAWGFGFGKKEKVTDILIDSIKTFTGFEKIWMKNKTIYKTDKRIMLDFSAIAKGYGVDIVADYLSKKGFKNYMVDIGGEVVAKGVNKTGNVWRIGINEPNDNEPVNARELQAIIKLPDMAIATSGNYRNFYIENGRKFAHTINPHTGYPVNHSLLSASVIAKNCITADAYATACMVLGVEKSLILAEETPEIEIFLIYADENGENIMTMTKGFNKYIVE